MIRNGGGLLGAFAEDGPPETGGMVGLTFWFPGLGVPTTGEGRGAVAPLTGERQHKDESSVDSTPAPRLKMCSHMAGVLPQWQGRGIGLLLKLAQRRMILEQGLTDWVTWTYDPLQRTNGVFNIRRLGAVCNTYKANWYGEMRDGLNAGTPSDRCQVDWWLRSARVEERGVVAPLTGEGRRGDVATVTAQPLQVLPTRATAAGFRAPVDTELRLEGTLLAVPIPDDIGAIRRADRELGMAWRLFMRRALESAFAAGYTMVDCIQLEEAGWHYVLSALSRHLRELCAFTPSCGEQTSRLES